MKTAYITFSCIIITVLLITAGCAKTLDDWINESLYAPKKILCRSWVKAEELHNPANVITNSFNTLQPCARDNAYKFDKDGYYEMNQGNSSCYATQPFLIENGRWDLLEHDTKLKLTLADGSVKRLYNVVQLDTNYIFIATYIDSSRGTKVEVKEKFYPQ
ncbi:MAG: hypothetical protein QM738_18815 [Ferruginibacter sp.]